MVIKLKGSYIATFFKTLLLGYFYKESYQKVTGPKNQPESRNYWPARPETHHRDTTFKTKLSVFPTRIWNQGNSRFQSRYRTLQLPRKNKLNSFWVQFFFFFQPKRAKYKNFIRGPNLPWSYSNSMWKKSKFSSSEYSRFFTSLQYLETMKLI